MNKKRLPIIIGIVVVVVVLIVVFDMILANHEPAIAGLEARERVVPNGRCEITCVASDRDGDALSYNWSASGGNISGTGPAVNWTAPELPGSYNVTVTVADGRGDEVTKQVTILVRANRAPSITDVAADASWTLPSGTVSLTCTASDPDGDQLTYEWTAAAGDISGTGPAVNWTAPQETGIYYITVVVMDSHGSSDIRTLSATVAQEEPPTIEGLLITKDQYGHCYLKKSGDKYLVGQEQKYDIECIVPDTSMGLSYEWAIECKNPDTQVYESPCDGGEFSGQGSMITWTAPSRVVDVRVTVMVFDIADNMATKSLLLNVVSCSRCTFGC